MTTEPIRVDMGAENNGLGEALMEALFSGRPIALHDSSRPHLPDVGFGMELSAADESGGGDDV